MLAAVHQSAVTVLFMRPCSKPGSSLQNNCSVDTQSINLIKFSSTHLVNNSRLFIKWSNLNDLIWLVSFFSRISAFTNKVPVFRPGQIKVSPFWPKCLSKVYVSFLFPSTYTVFHISCYSLVTLLSNKQMVVGLYMQICIWLYLYIIYKFVWTVHNCEANAKRNIKQSSFC